MGGGEGEVVFSSYKFMLRIKSEAKVMAFISVPSGLIFVGSAIITTVIMPRAGSVSPASQHSPIAPDREIKWKLVNFVI